jgi:hypothetical protein
VGQCACKVERHREAALGGCAVVMAHMKEAVSQGGLTALALQEDTVALRDEMAL